jgi:hypothetical protein
MSNRTIYGVQVRGDAGAFILDGNVLASESSQDLSNVPDAAEYRLDGSAAGARIGHSNNQHHSMEITKEYFDVEIGKLATRQYLFGTREK